LGLRDAGFRVLASADHDPMAVESHEANIGGLGYCGDLGDPEEFLDLLDAWGIHSVDLVAGGPPCQPFSRAGRSRLRGLAASGERSAQDHRAALWTSYVKVIEVLQPRAVLMENVPDLASWNDGAVLTSVLEALRELGYRVDARVLEAWRYGVPQHRSRLFVVGLRRDLPFFVWPKGKSKPTLRDAIADLPAVAGAQRREVIAYWAEDRSWLAKRLRRDVPSAEAGVVFDHITREVRPDDAEAFALLPEGGTYEDLPPHLQRYRTDIFSDKYKRLEWDGLSRTITAHLAKDGYWYIHPEQHRTLSVREAARIQTFPDTFRFAGEPTHRYRQIGNAVPPLLAEALGHSIRKALRSDTKPVRAPGAERELFRAHLLEWHERHRRDYPWRHASDPWHVLMAEMCLRRTRADQAAPVFEELLRHASTPAEMLRNECRAVAAMESLGLRWRADNLLACARDIVERFDGAIPDNDMDLQSLPGVGDYVAQAVLCFGFGRPSVLIDTNTDRIIGRLNRRHGNAKRWQTRLDLFLLAGAAGPDATFNYALLDLGALVCRATAAPLCESCPVAEHCRSAGKVAPKARKRASTARRDAA
jgi:DNA (cytosine-5)-methyltransferase 1